MGSSSWERTKTTKLSAHSKEISSSDWPVMTETVRVFSSGTTCQVLRSNTALTLAGVPSRGTWVPFSSMPGLLAFPADQSPGGVFAGSDPLPPEAEGFE